ncbi:MAG: hypothetical protein ACD_20C00152G0002 [uncultured bacterium]|nr:MAG: hypothetical protein ACD_20C00152G0002 [uncultured bacterium]
MQIKIIFLIIGLIFNLLLNSNIAYAMPNIKVSSLGSVIKSGNTTIQNISLNFITDSSWQILVSPVDACLRNSYYPAKNVSLERLLIENNRGVQLNLPKLNKPVILDSGTETGSINRQYILRYKNSDADYPGLYTGSLQFTLISGSGTEMDIYSLSIEQPVEQKIIAESNIVNLDIKSTNILKKGFMQESELPTKLYVRSNTEWKLVLKKNNYNDFINLKFKVLSVPDNCRTQYNSDYFDLPNGNFVIMEGNPTLDASGKGVEAKMLEINYQIKTKDGQILPAGPFQFDAYYTLMPR